MQAFLMRHLGKAPRSHNSAVRQVPAQVPVLATLAEMNLVLSRSE
ncbi:hypothetical protein SAMN05414139_10376 [Burkholderia sp. D7]|nr:hypothetical protein SAMN05414139_10376 [Burkholderia sp. D7]